MKKTVLLFILCLFTLLTAVPASPYPISVKQPDGSKLTIKLKGDEYVNWAQTEDGYTLLKDSGFYCYATKSGEDLVSSGIRAHDNEKSVERSFRSMNEPDLRFSQRQIDEKLATFPKRDYLQRVSRFPTSGTRNLLMILVNFSDTSTLYSQNDFNNYMNQVNYNGTGSFKDYYLECSHNQLTVNTTVTAWVTVSGTHDSYGPESMWDILAYQAVQAADAAGVDFSLFDNDNDGSVDGVAIIHQGSGQEATGDTDDVWSHSYTLEARYSTGQRTFDGVLVGEYTMQPEIYGTGTTMSTIGVMCHEFGHNLGAPDYYDTDYSANGQQSGTGYWDLMGSGSWNNNGYTPAHHNPFTKWKHYGWTSPALLQASSRKTLDSVVDSNNDFYYFETSTADEYFLLENRQKVGFDASLPGHGLMIYHVDEDYIFAHQNANDINATSHQGLYPKAANGTVNYSSCPFPGTSNNTLFNDDSTPNSKSWAGEDSYQNIVIISESGGNVTFDYLWDTAIADITTPDTDDYVYRGTFVPVAVDVSTFYCAVNYVSLTIKNSSGVTTRSLYDYTAPYSFILNTESLSVDRYSLTAQAHIDGGITLTDLIHLNVNSDPEPATNPTPEDLAVDVEPSTLLSWLQSTTGIDPDAYKLYLGTTNPPTTLVMNDNVTSFNPTLNYGTTYYWQVVPYTVEAKSAKGNATNCPVWSFTTMEIQATDDTPSGNITPVNDSEIPEGTAITVEDPPVTPEVPEGSIAIEDVVISVTSSTPVELTVTIYFDSYATSVYYVEGGVYIPDEDLTWDIDNVSFDYMFAGTTKGSYTFVVTEEGIPLAISFSLFEAEVLTAEDVEIHWVTESEAYINHYNVLRSKEDPAEEMTNLTIDSPIFAKHNETTTDYYYTDKEFKQGETYFYWLEAVDYSGHFSLYGPIEVTCEYNENPEDIPEASVTSLTSLYPNPFNPNLNISFSLKEEQDVSIEIYNTKGQLVSTLAGEHLQEGEYTRVWNGLDNKRKAVPSGIYFIRLMTDSKVFTNKAVLLK